MTKFLSFFLLSFLFIINGYTQTINTDRPSQSESSSTIPKGSFQTETGIQTTMNWNPVLKSRDYSYYLPTSLFRIALSDRFEIRVMNSLKLERSRIGVDIVKQQLSLDDLQVGFKWQFNDGNDNFAEFALSSVLVSPTSISTHIPAFGTINKILMSSNLTDNLSIGINLGHAYFGKGNGDLLYTLILAYSLSDRLGIYMEGYGDYANFTHFGVNADAGFTVLLKENIQFDYSFGFGITSEMNYQGIGFSMLFGNK